VFCEVTSWSSICFAQLYTHPPARLAICPLPEEWAVPQMLRVVACIHALYTPAGRQALAPVAAALDMAPQERALYLRRGPVGKAAAKVGNVVQELADVRSCA